MSANEGKSFLMDRYLDELKRLEEKKSKDSVNEVQVLKEQLRVLSAEMISLRQALGFHQRPGSHPRHAINNQDSGYSDNLAESLSASSSISSASSTTSSTTPNSSSYSVSCPCFPNQRRPPPMTSDLYGRLNDLVKMPKPVTEESVCKALQQRWMCGECQTKIGPVIVALNPQRGLSEDQVLGHTQPHQHPHLQRLAQRVHTQLVEQRRPQTVILSGESGSGKTYTSQLFLRQLHSLCKKRPTTVGGGGGGGPSDQTENKQFQNLTHAFHVLRAVGCAKTRHNSCASRLGHHVEVHFAGNTITRTKFECHWFDQSRVVDTPAGESNFHIFYQMLAGLSHEERAKLHLHGYGVHNLAYLKQRKSSEDVGIEKERFHSLKIALSTLGIEFLDVMRILSAILLLGNVNFVEDGGYELDIKGSSEIKAVASLLGVPGVSLYRALTTKTHTIKGQAVKTLCNAEQANETRDTLAKALYCRVVLSITKRINSVFKPNSKCPPYVAPSVSSEDTQSSGDSCSRLSDSTMELNGNLSSIDGSTHLQGTVHIIDIPGFSNTQCNRIEDLCCNYSSEVLHQVYLQQTFKISQDACREDGVAMNPVPFQDNISCVDFFASKHGLFPTIDTMCNQPEHPTPDELISRTNKKHHRNGVFSVERENKHLFTIRHTSGEVRYSATDLLKRSRDVISDDVLTIFRRKGCNFGFASYLFAPELKLLQGNAVKGLLFRICPRPQISLESRTLPDPSIGSIPIDTHHRLTELLDSFTRQQAQFHFIHCIKINDQESSSQFSYAVVARQTRAFQLMTTLQHMTDGYPYCDTILNFARRYQMMLERWQRKKTPRDQCKVILEQIMRRCELIESVNTQNKWIISENRVFFSEETRQGLESVRDGHRDTAARFLQSKVRCWLARRHWPSDIIDPYEECTDHHVTRISFREPLYERINYSVSDSSSVISDDTSSSSIECKKARLQNRVYHTAKEDVPPPLPSNHPSSVKIDVTKGFPQTRIMRCNYSPDISCVEPLLRVGEPILVVGVNNTKTILIVEHNNCTLQVPLKLTMSQTGDCILGTRL
ncbi:unconventional myosin-X-like [Lytechinus variegatus]|uniref:unconventional myosin-X-like n=1 Tax=Lytechinus variegatus TaxID=7654 RepID=UPI001BB1E1D1|nr:unconventional myosin-X-like [Lytechinus variegatus]